MRTYTKVNITIAVALSLVLLLLLFTTLLGIIKCPFNSKLGIPCKSCGISRDMLQYLQLNFAAPINAHSLKIFIFFIGQILIRTYLGTFKEQRTSSFIKLDIGLSAIWFAWVFILLILR